MKKLIAGVLAVGLAFTTVVGVHPEKADAHRLFQDELQQQL